MVTDTLNTFIIIERSLSHNREHYLSVSLSQQEQFITTTTTTTIHHTHAYPFVVDSLDTHPTQSQPQRKKRRTGPAGLNNNDDDEESTKIDEDEIIAEESEGEGEDLLDQLQTDYRAIPELDRYDDRQLDDDSDVSEITFQGRAAAEQLMQQRDRRDRAVRSRLPAALQDMYENAEKGGGMDDEDDEEAEERRRRRRMEEAADGLDETSFDTGMFSGLPTQEDEPYDLTGVQGFVKDWILLDAPRREVKRLFRKFLHEYNDERLQLVYKDRIQQMCAANQQSLKVNYKHLAKSNPRVAIWLADAPRQVISLFDEVALEEVLKQFPNYEDTHRTLLLLFECKEQERLCLYVFLTFAHSITHTHTHTQVRFT